jgi:hypothetical protein
MNLKKKFESIDQSQLNQSQKEILSKIKTATKDFTITDEKALQKVDGALDNIIAKLKSNNPQAIKGEPKKKEPNQKIMEKYIEIIFDDSASMNSLLNGELKHITAKNIIKEQIIPKIDFKNSEVYLRTLSQDCRTGFSKAIKLSGTIQRINDEIDNIHCDKSTPLYYTIKDSIDACKNSGFSESHIFILTDGDDTCSKNPEQILGIDFLKIKNQINLNTILVQFVIESNITKNNLTALSQKIGATNVVIDTKDLKNKVALDHKITKSFIKTGLNKEIPFPHCQVEIKNDISLAELTEYDFYLVQLLHQEKFLSWKPTLKKKLNSEQMAELDFLYSLRFKNNLPEAQVRLMLSSLQKPYIYSFNCMYWDFNERVWKYFEKLPDLTILDNPDAINQDITFDSLTELKDEIEPLFIEDKIYMVEKIKDDLFTMINKNHTELNDVMCKPLIIKLNNGDFVMFGK